AYFELGLQLIGSGRPVPAIESFEQAAKEDGSSPDAGTLAMSLGQAHAQAGAGARALRAFLRAALDLPSMFGQLVDAAFGVLDVESANTHIRYVIDSWLPRAKSASLTEPDRALAFAFACAAELMAADVQQAVDRLSGVADNAKPETWQAVFAR